MHPDPIGEVPAETVRVARAAFPKGTVVTRLRDKFSALFEDEDFRALYPVRGQPGLPPWRLALITWKAEPRATSGGQRWYSPLAILTALILRAVFRLALRQTEGLMDFIIHLLGLALAAPDHSTLSRRAKTLEVPRPRPRHDGEPLHLLVDSTGLKLCGAGEWLIEKHGTKTRWS